MTARTVEHPIWGKVDVLQDGGSWILCQVEGEARKVSKAWLRERGVAVDDLFKQAEIPPRKQRPLRKNLIEEEPDLDLAEDEEESGWEELEEEEESEELD